MGRGCPGDQNGSHGYLGRAFWVGDLGGEGRQVPVNFRFPWVSGGSGVAEPPRVCKNRSWD